jgi:hypothetical protein
MSEFHMFPNDAPCDGIYPSLSSLLHDDLKFHNSPFPTIFVSLHPCQHKT